MRATPVLNRKILEQSSADEAFLAFVTVTHPEMTETIRLVLDGADYVIDGETWHRSFFEIEQLTDTDQPPSLRFRLPNVDRQAISMLSAVGSPPRLELALAMSGYFDLTQEPRVVKDGVTFVWSNKAPDGTLLYRASGLFLTDVKADAAIVEGTCRSWDLRQESWPDKRVTQALLPGAFVR